MNPQRKSNALQLVLFTTATLLVIVSIASLAAAQEYNTRQKTVVMPSEQKVYLRKCDIMNSLDLNSITLKLRYKFRLTFLSQFKASQISSTTKIISRC